MVSIMTFDVADVLCTEVMDFLVSRGGPYKAPNVLTELTIMESFRSGQYVLGRNEDGSIRYFADFWRLQPEDLVLVAKCELPSCFDSGPVVYVVDAACVPGAMREMVKALKRKAHDWVGVFWRSYKHGRIMAFPGCCGEKYE